MTALPAFGSVKECPKCGARSTRLWVRTCWEDGIDRVKRTCLCGHHWYEATMVAGEGDGCPHLSADGSVCCATGCNVADAG